MNKTLLAGAAIVILLAIGGGYYFATSQKTATTISNSQINTQTPATGSIEISEKKVVGTFTQQKFENIKTPHFVSSEPDNNEIQTAVPSKVAISFNFDLGTNSKISVKNTQSNANVTTGQAEISADKLTLSVPANLAQSGNYKVDYTACWPDGSCHNGSFGFSVNLE